ncbi:MAG: asparagine synthase C-terminal domain-containing protein [Nitrososphaerales archaeon]
MESVCDEIRRALHESISRNRCDAILLSGGIDSSILASMASKLNRLTGITVTRDDSPDLRYARIIAAKYSIRHLVKSLTLEDMKDAVENVVRIMRSFDPMEVRNTTVLYRSILALKENGFGSVMTGDGGDELFVGYKYLLRLEHGKLEDELRKLWGMMHFSSIAIGRELGVTVRMPYLDDEFAAFAKKIPLSLKVRERDGRKCGKWILRSCFEQEITGEIAWREKMPLEQGAGTSVLTQHFDSAVGDQEFSSGAKRYALQDAVRIRDKEQMHYYEVYRKFYDAPKDVECEVRCPDCQGCVRHDSRFCSTCGAFPIRPSTEKKKRE